MTTIRETALANLEEMIDNYLRERAINTHLSSNVYTLYCYPDGEIVISEEVDRNTRQYIKYPTKPVLALDVYGGSRCNCDWCTEWDDEESSVRGDYESKVDYIADCVDNNIDTLLDPDDIYDALRDAPYGYFDDEATRGGKREGAGRPKKNHEVVYLRMDTEVATLIRHEAEVQGFTLGEIVEGYVTRFPKMEFGKTVSKREALMHICATYTDYASQYEDWDDGETLRYAIEVINKIDGDTIEANDVKGFGTPYTDLLWEALQ